MAVSRAQVRAKVKNRTKVYDRFEITLRKDGRDKEGNQSITLEDIDRAAADAGMTRPEFVLSAILDKMGRPKQD